MTAVHRAMAQLESWPNLVSGPPRCAIGHGIATADHDIVHFHSEDAADVCLTRGGVERILPQLRHSSAIRVMPGAAWVTVLLDCDTDIDLLLCLVSLALKENARECGARPDPPCAWERPGRAVPCAAGEATGTGGAADGADRTPPHGTHGMLPSARRAVGRLMHHGRRAS
ncbi:luciferase family protein [Actinomycetota bacterium Odt1-20B]